MQALLALDPHSARVQPRPELLYFTPAGFHVSVMKTLMEGLVMWPSTHAEASRPSKHDQFSSMQQGMNALRSQGKQQQQQLQQEQVQQQQRDGPQAEQQQQGHCQQLQQNVPFWSQAVFPAWYMWWHIGLLAYHQQQQQQRCKTAGNAVQPESAGTCSSSACTACCSKVQLQDLYSSTDAR